jgi:guanine deaminase
MPSVERSLDAARTSACATGVYLMTSQEWMRQVIDLAVQNVQSGGGPFAALVVKDGRAIATGANCVTRSNDPTAHAEVIAIRNACRELGTFQLSGCEIYTSCEPCPMCLGAIYWARPERFYFASGREDAASYGFDDSFIYNELDRPHEERTISGRQLLREEGLVPFEQWMQNPKKIPY